MKPVAICRYAPHEGAGYFATYLTRREIPWRLVKVDAGEPLPHAGTFSGLAMMGGPMSVNDPLPWIPAMLALVRECVRMDLPVIGHCLGGQLLSKAMGGRVTVNAVKEIGWGEVDVLDVPAAREWGPAERFVSYQWHGETFSVPDGAVRVWSGRHCENQAFVMGRHIGMQSHVEITEELIRRWCESGSDEIAENLGRSPAVQPCEAMRENLPAKLDALRRVAERVYGRWTEGLMRGDT